jgi:hypothetical protein
MTWDFMATLAVMDGKTIGIAYYRFTDAYQDYFILEATGDAILREGIGSSCTALASGKA